MKIVLMYHRVTTTDLDPFNLVVSPSHFKEHLAVLRRLAVPRRLIDVVDDWSKDDCDVAVTFDDGYADNLLEALPALEAEDIPATIFVSTGMLDSDGFWIDRLTQCLLPDRVYPDRVDIEIDGRPISLDLRTPASRQVAHQNVHSMLRNLHPDVIAKKIAELARLLRVDPTPPASDRPLTRQETSNLAFHPLIDLGGHTVNHPCLARQKSADQRWEIETCKTELQSLGAPGKLSFAYPFGDPTSHSFITRRLVKRAGWHNAVISDPKQGWWFRRYAVPRYYVGDWDGDGFEKRFAKWVKSIR